MVYIFSKYLDHNDKSNVILLSDTVQFSHNTSLFPNYRDNSQPALWVHGPGPFLLTWINFDPNMVK